MNYMTLHLSEPSFNVIVLLPYKLVPNNNRDELHYSGRSG